MPLHDAAAFCDGHATHELVPQEVSAPSDTHAPLQSWKPGLQVKPHVPAALHVALAFAGGTHGMHELPQVFGLVLLAHAPVQGWKFAAQVS